MGKVASEPLNAPAERGLEVRKDFAGTKKISRLRCARRYEDARMKRVLHCAEALRDPKRNPHGYRSDEAFKVENAFHEQRNQSLRVTSPVPDPTALLVIDEADRLKVAGREQVRNIFDHAGIDLVLIEIPGIEKRLASYPQFYSRIGFVHEFRPLAAKEIRQLLEQCWTPPGVHLPRSNFREPCPMAHCRNDQYSSTEE